MMWKGKPGRVIPSWDGQPSGWRMYKRGVRWYASGTAYKERPQIAAKLVPQLTDAAARSVSRWDCRRYEKADGVWLFLLELARSPLPRRALNEAAQSFERYFHRSHGYSEGIPQHNVREDEQWHTFLDAAKRLIYEQRPKLPEFYLKIKQCRDERARFKRQQAEQWKRDSGQWSDYDQAQDGEQDDEQEAEVLDDDVGVHEHAHESIAAEPEDSDENEEPSDSDDNVDMDGGFWRELLELIRGWRLLDRGNISESAKVAIIGDAVSNLNYNAIPNLMRTNWDQPGGKKGKGGAKNAFAFDWHPDAQWSSSGWDNALWEDSSWTADDDWGAWPDDSNWPVTNSMWQEEWQGDPWQDDPWEGWYGDSSGWMNAAGAAAQDDPSVPANMSEEERDELESLQEQLEEHSANAAEQVRTLREAREVVRTFNRDRQLGKQKPAPMRQLTGKPMGKGLDAGCFICGGPIVHVMALTRRWPRCG